MQLAEFNALAADDAARAVAVWAAIPEWIDAVVAARPYASVDVAHARADLLAREWTDADLDAALSQHPRIGQKSTGSGAEAVASAREQSSMAAASASTAEAMATANADYEARFGRVFLIRAGGRSAEEMLTEARRRLRNDDATEAAEARDQLRQIALLRLRTTLED